MRTFLVLCKKRKFFTKAPPSTLALLFCTFIIENHVVQFDGGRFKQEILFRCEYYLVLCKKRKYFTKAPPQLEDLRKKFSLDAIFSCVMQETKIFHLDGGRFKDEILFRCERFLCYARNENISPGPPLNWKI